MSVADKLGLGPFRHVEKIDTGYRITVTPPAFVGTRPQSVNLTDDQYRRYQQWLDGELIQRALPDLSGAEREILLTGIGDDDFNRLFPDDEED